MRIAVTGANGFVGRALCALLCDTDHDVTALVRHVGVRDSRVREVIVADDNFASLAAGDPALAPCDVLIHLAARVHMMTDDSVDPLAAYRATNVDGTLNAARAAHRAGARRIVFVSSVKALGEGEPGRPWREDDPPAPVDPYGISKFEAETALTAFGRANGVEIAIVRPPLVYGPGVRANFLGLIKAVERGVPLPLGAVDARRSMVYVGNLADAIRTLATHAGPVGGVFHVSDLDDLTVTGMIRAIAGELHRPARLWPVPVAWLRAAGKAAGKGPQVQRLTSSLRLDCTRLPRELGWTPPRSVSQGLAETVRAFRESR
ncbi:NAD-dependent epimerase/dehydratase family protein [Paraburkholderia humisilvae]|uniref:N-acetyl-alpha-D-glucosaminyl-diphospho-ditrans, octacis-undecaprenol 4-epimerase n=1 Tax=Paraburkholderia humisilvae TaxID=627669 RepID=A0A6J5E2G7_9BURK|nr:NAD-dependent epimerase/dehydratase family protein [Paraburkholderia humisilvae]CAB3760217.1 N-acetyl-alpha-D-glucosaminyl-diphospho-ditrans, octacis-undecaprenol 4-epimerase [Paraburkholderia humisilvae]